MPVQQLGAPLPTLTDYMNANEDRDIKNSISQESIRASQLKNAQTIIDQAHAAIANVSDEASYQISKKYVEQTLGMDTSDFPKNYDQAFIDKAKKDTLTVKEQLGLAIDQMKADNPFGNSLDGKRAAAAARGDWDTVRLLDEAITANAKARGTPRMLDYGGNVIDARSYPDQRPGGISGMMGSGNIPQRQPQPSPAPAQPNVILQPNDGTTFTNPPTNPKERQKAFETNEDIRKEAGIIKAKTQTQAEIDLPGIENTAVQLNDLLERLINHPGLSKQTGLISDIPVVPGGEGANFMALYDQIKGQQFMEAFKTLKGGGQITEKEGEKATDALAAMQRSQSTQDFIKNTRIFQNEIKKLVEIARNKAKGNFTPQRRLDDPLPPSNDGVIDYRDYFK